MSNDPAGTIISRFTKRKNWTEGHELEVQYMERHTTIKPLAQIENEMLLSSEVFDRNNLLDAARMADTWSFNQRLSMKTVANLPNHNYPVISAPTRRYWQGLPCDPYVQCKLSLGPANANAYLIVDVPPSFYRKLPSK